jgi:hypothetical protein
MIIRMTTSRRPQRRYDHRKNRSALQANTTGSSGTPAPRKPS